MLASATHAWPALKSLEKGDSFLQALQASGEPLDPPVSLPEPHMESLVNRLKALAHPAASAAGGLEGEMCSQSESTKVPLDSAGPDFPNSRLSSDLPLPAISGYEVLCELGRGGMGVVYKARQISLKRLVALKMIRGLGAGKEELDRFRREAEAIARLHHPNIVQIHEIGDVGGQPFFSLEFIEGGSLDRLIKGQPQDPVQAARLVETLARAMAHSHQQGIVHRDLKPGNILLQMAHTVLQTEPWSASISSSHLQSAIPKITDFGLAKQLAVDAEHTRTGAVMGTPSYMAPEQAEGRIQHLGPLTDVYALGAILYELLTGRPPFRGANAMDTLEMVRTQAPAPPSRIVRGVPRDLETICVVALAKDPTRRYASAVALANDLARFLAGEPILAKRQSIARKVIRQVRRHRLVLSAACLVLVVAAVSWRLVRHSEAESDSLTLLNQVDQALTAPAWVPAKLENQLELAIQLNAIHPARAAEARRRIHQRLASFIQDQLRQPGQLTDQETTSLDAALAWLEKLDADRAGPLREARKHRQSQWQTVIDLRAPFLQSENVFAAGTKIEIHGNKLMLAAIRGEPASIATQVSCRGHLDLAAEFDESWDQAKQIGLMLNWEPHDRVHALAHPPAGSSVAVARDSGAVEMMDTKTGLVLWQQQGHGDKPATCLAFSVDGKILLSGGTDGRVCQWDPETGSLRKAFAFSKQPITSIALAKDGDTAAVGHVTDVRVWRLSDGKELPTLTSPRHDGTPRSNLTGPIKLSFSSDGKTLFAGWFVFLAGWDVATGKQTFVDASHYAAIYDMALSRDDKLFFTASSTNKQSFVQNGGSANFVEPAANKLPGSIIQDIGQALLAKCFAISPDGRYLAIGCSNGVIHKWDIDGRKMEQVYELRDSLLEALTFTPDGLALIVADRAGGLFELEMATRRSRIYQAPGHYMFLLSSNSFHTPPPGNNDPEADLRKTIAEAREAGEPILQLFIRNGVVQKEAKLIVPPGRIRLHMHRENETVTMQVNNAIPLEFNEFQMFRPEGGRFGVFWPRGAGLTGLQAKTQDIPSRASSLEKADALFASGDWTEALASYEDHLRVAKHLEKDRLAVELKAAVCLVNANRVQQGLERLLGIYNSSTAGARISGRHRRACRHSCSWIAWEEMTKH